MPTVEKIRESSDANRGKPYARPDTDLQKADDILAGRLARLAIGKSRQNDSGRILYSDSGQSNLESIAEEQGSDQRTGRKSHDQEIADRLAQLRMGKPG